MVKFSRASLQKILIGHAGEEVEIKVTGAYKDGTAFEGADTIRVIDPGKRGTKPWDGTSEGDDNKHGKGNDGEDEFTKNWKFGWENGDNGKSKNKGWY
jgi:hypothetical protein